MAKAAIDIPEIEGLSEIAPGYDAIFCDVWGVLIDGKRHFPEAAAALQNFRGAGGTVILITNSSRPDDEVCRQLFDFGLPQSAFDDLISAGELTLAEMLAHTGRRPYHLGPPRDNDLFEEAARRLGRPLDKVSPDLADYVVCTGLLDDRNEQPSDYDGQLSALKARNLTMLCANPDIVVAIGDELVYCAGALAARYAAMGGEVIMFGKPHAPIYAAARARLAALRGAPTPDRRILCVGDGAFTDIAGASRSGLDCLFVTDGVHRDELRPDGSTLDKEALARLMLGAGGQPVALARSFFW